MDEGDEGRRRTKVYFRKPESTKGRIVYVNFVGTGIPFTFAERALYPTPNLDFTFMGAMVTKVYESVLL